MKLALALVMGLHGLIHLMGFAKAFGYAELPQLTQPIGRPVGVLWLVACLALLVGAAALYLLPQRWWWAAVPAALLSQAVILTSFHDAKAGTLANLLILAAAAVSFATAGNVGLRREYRRDVERGLARLENADSIGAHELSRLPEAVRAYLAFTGSLDRPRATRLRARFRGRIRNGFDGPWMPFEAEQTSFLENSTRLFFLEARMFGVPVVGYHVYRDGASTMRVRVAGLLPIVDGRGEEMFRSETVTFLNDLCLLAPSALVDPTIRWEELDARRAIAVFERGNVTVRAQLGFDERGALTSFVSDDRSMSSDGKTFVRLPWSTPVHEYRTYGPHRLAARGDAVWQTSDGPFTYGEFELVDLTYDVGPALERTRLRPASSG